MTCREKLAKEHPELVSIRIDAVGCPHSYGYAEKYKYCEDEPVGSPVKCSNCWDREIPEDTESKTEVKDLDGGVWVQDPDKKGWKKEEPKTICAHIGPFDESLPTVAESSKNVRENFESMVDALNSIGNPHPIRPEDLKYALDENDDCVPHILDSGNRREFETGAVRDIQEGKGRCDLLPLDVVAQFVYGDGYKLDPVLEKIIDFQQTGMKKYLYMAIEEFNRRHWNDRFTACLEVSKHFEEGCKKYGENNWQKGIPVRCYIDSAVRHYLKFLRGDKDEPHDRAFCWNILCAIWTCKHKPELNDYRKEGSENAG